MRVIEVFKQQNYFIHAITASTDIWSTASSRSFGLRHFIKLEMNDDRFSLTLRPSQIYSPLKSAEQFKRKIQMARSKIEESISVYEKEELELSRIKELDTYLRESLARSPEKKSHVIIDMLARNEARLADSTYKYFYGMKVDFTRHKGHKRPPTSQIEINPPPKPRPCDSHLRAPSEAIYIKIPNAFPEKADSKSDSYSPRKPLSHKRKVVSQRKPNLRQFKIAQDFKIDKKNHARLEKRWKIIQQTADPLDALKKKEEQRICSMKNSFAKYVSRTPGRMHHHRTVDLSDGYYNNIARKVDGQILPSNKYVKEQEATKKMTDILQAATASSCHYVRRTKFHPVEKKFTQPLVKRIDSTRNRLPIRGGLGKRRPKTFSPPSITSPFTELANIALRSALRGKVVRELGPAVNLSDCFDLKSEQVEKRYGHLKSRAAVAACKTILVEQYYRKKKALICIQRFLRRWNWKRQWRATIRSHLAVYKSATIIIQQWWRLRHFSKMISILLAQKVWAVRRIQRWWKKSVIREKEDEVKEQRFNVNRVAIIKCYNKVLQESGGKFLRHHFSQMLGDLWKIPPLNSEELDDIMFEIVNEANGHLPIEGILRWFKEKMASHVQL
jgi:hypothetical protein